MADEGNTPTFGEIIHAADIVKNYATKTELDTAIGDINTILDENNGEVM